jgi:2-iminoacetate synthase
MTFQEYLIDYASSETRELGQKAINNFIGDIRNDKVRVLTTENLEKIKDGQRDLYL